MKGNILKVKAGIETSVFDSGDNNKTYLIIFNNRYWKVSDKVYYILQSIDGNRTIEDIKEYLSDSYSYKIEIEQLEKIIDLAFINNGLIEGTDAITPPKKNKMFWGRITLIKPNIVEKFKVFSFFFGKKVIMPLGMLVILWIIYILFNNTNSEVLNKFLNLNIYELLLCYIYISFAGLIHELGHTISAMKYGSKAGRIGAGVYIIMPVLSADVTDVWKLKRSERVIVDLGGMYLQGIFLIISYIINFLFVKSEILNIGIIISSFQILGNLNPFIKFDGYWVLTDYLGVSEIKTVMVECWKNLFGKLLKKQHKQNLLTKDKEIIIYIYSIFTFCFYLYFIKFFSDSLILAFQNIVIDINSISEIGLFNLDITFYNIIQYISSRITTLIILFMLFKMIWYLIKKLIILCYKINLKLKSK